MIDRHLEAVDPLDFQMFEISLPPPSHWWPRGAAEESAIDYDNARLVRRTQSLPLATNKRTIHEPGRPLKVHEIACHLFPSLWKVSQS